MPDAPTPEMLKKMKIDSDSNAAGPSSMAPPPPPKGAPSSSASKSGPKRAYARDEEDEEAEAEARAGDFAPGGDADYFTEEDDEGRFFGGGLTSEQKEILNIFDNAGEGAPDDVRCLRSQLSWSYM